MLIVFGEMDWEKGWTQQFHYGAIRNNNTKMFKLLGPDTGFDSIGEFTTAKAMAKFLDRLNTEGKLTKTIRNRIESCLELCHPGSCLTWWQLLHWRKDSSCKLSDHGIEEFYAEDYTDAEINAIFNKVYGGTELTKEEILKFK